MKTVKQLFEEQEDGVREVLLARLDSESGNSPSPDIFSAINQGFTWYRTPEGEMFWSDVCNTGGKAGLLREKLEKEIGYSMKGSANCFTISFNKRNGTGKANVSAYNSPFGNCQNCSIANYNVILSEVPAEHVPGLTQLIAKDFSKKFVVLDLNQMYMAQVNKIFGKSMFETPYVSTNGSKMCIVGLNVHVTFKAEMTEELKERIRSLGRPKVKEEKKEVVPEPELPTFTAEIVSSYPWDAVSNTIINT